MLLNLDTTQIDIPNVFKFQYLRQKHFLDSLNMV